MKNPCHFLRLAVGTPVTEGTSYRSALAVLCFALAVLGCGDDARSSDADGGIRDGSVISGASCEALGAVCGWQTDSDGRALFCGLCRWAREEVAEEGWSVAMQMGEGDTVDALYFNSTGLMHATRSSAGAWEHEMVAAVVTEDSHTAPRLVRASGQLHAVFVTPENIVQLATRDGGSWLVEPFGQGEFADLAVATDGTQHVVWSFMGKLQHAQGGPGDWTASDIGESARAPSIVLDANATAHVVWADWNQKLRYATKPSTGPWVVEDVADQSRHAGGNGRPHIALSGTEVPWLAHDSVGRAQVARRTGGNWVVEDINTDNRLFSETVLAARLGFVLGRNDRPFVGLTIQASFNDDSFVVATPDDDLWGRQPIAPAGGADPYASIALDLAASGEPAAFFASEDVGVRFMMPVAAYSSEHEARCASLASAIYEDACACDDTCCHGPPGSTRSICCKGAGCSGDTRAKLCGDPTRDESELVACEQSLSETMCGPIASGEHEALAVPETCFPG